MTGADEHPATGAQADPPPSVDPADYGQTLAHLSQYGQLQYGVPYPLPPQNGQAQYGVAYPVQPQYVDPQYVDPQYVDPQYVDPQYVDPQYVDPQYVDPQYVDPQYVDPQYGQPYPPHYAYPAYAPYGYPQYGEPYPPQYAQYVQPYPPQYGEPADGTPSPTATPPPELPASSDNRSLKAGLLVVLGLVVVLAVAGVAAFAASRGEDKNLADALKVSGQSTSSLGFAPPPALTPSGTAGASGASSPSGGSADVVPPPSPTGTAAPANGPSITDSKVVASRYFNDLNSKNRADARTLLCNDAKADYDTTANDPDSDFAYTWSNVAYLSAGAVHSDVTVLTYTVTVAKGATSNDGTFRLYFVDEGGAKICGEAAN